MASYVPFPTSVDLKTKVLQNCTRNFLSRKYSRSFEVIIAEINIISKSAIGRSEKLEEITRKIHLCLLYRQKLPLKEFLELIGAYVVAYDKESEEVCLEEVCLGDFYKNIEDYRNLIELIYKESFQEEGANAQKRLTALGCKAQWENWDTYLEGLDGVTTDNLMDIIETHLEFFPFENPDQKLAVIQGLLSKLKDDDTKKYDLKYRLLYILKGLVSEIPLLNGHDPGYEPYSDDAVKEQASPSNTLESLVEKASPGSAKGERTKRDRGQKHLNGCPNPSRSTARALFQVDEASQVGYQECQPASDQRTRSYTPLKTCLIALLIIGGASAIYVNRATLAPYVRRVKKWFGQKIGSI